MARKKTTVTETETVVETSAELDESGDRTLPSESQLTDTPAEVPPPDSALDVVPEEETTPADMRPVLPSVEVPEEGGDSEDVEPEPESSAHIEPEVPGIAPEIPRRKIGRPRKWNLDGTPVTPVKAKAPVKERAEDKPRRPRAAPVAAIVKQQTAGNVCSNPHCNAVHPSRGGKRGVQCVETGATIHEPMSEEAAAQLIGAALGGIGYTVGFFAGVKISGPSDLEKGAMAPPTARIIHRYLGSLGTHSDLIVLAVLLTNYITARVLEVQNARPQLRAA